MARPKSATIDLKVRMKEPLRARIEKAAKDRGVSLNAEIVDRVEKSFLKADALGNPELVGLFQMMAGAVAIIEARYGNSWSTDWDTSVAVQAAWTKLMEAVAAKPPPVLVRLLDDAIPDDTGRGGELSDSNDPVETEAGIDELRKWRNRLTRNEGLGRDVADELFPDRATVTETGNPS